MGNKDEYIGRHAMTELLGEEFTKQFNAAEAEAYRHEGGAKWLKDAAKTIVKNLHVHVDKDLAAGEGEGNNGFPRGGTDIEIATYVKRYLTRASEAMNNLALKAQADSSVAHGKRAAFDAALNLVKRHNDLNAMGVRRLTEAEEARKALLNGEVPAETSEEDKAFIDRVRAADDPLEVPGSGRDGRQSREERKLASLELERRAAETSDKDEASTAATDKPKPKKKRATKRKAKKVSNGAAASS